MIKKLFFISAFSAVGLLAAVSVSAQTCPHIYEGINCGSNWYCNGCQTSCKTCPGGGDPTGATQLNYVSCSCSCPSGQIVCAGACVTAPACSTPTREQNNSSCSGCGACKAGYSPDPGAPDAPNPCLKTAYIDYANVGTFFQISGDLKSAAGDLYLASGKAVRIDGTGTTILNFGNYTGTSLNTFISGGLVVKGGMALTSQGAGTINAEKLCIAGDCRDFWPAAVSAFVQGGNNFGALAVLGTNDSYDLSIRTNSAEKMRVTTGGSVGIGTTTPAYKLDVSGQANATQICIAGNCRGAWPAPGGSDAWVQFNDGGNFGGSSGFVYDKTNYSLLVAGVVGLNGLGTTLNTGIQSRGTSAGGFFRDSDNTGYVYTGFGDYGVYGYGSQAGLYGTGGTQGVYGNGTTYGVYGSSTYAGVYGSGSTYGVYGATSFSGSDAGFFSNTGSSTYARLGYSSWAGYFGGNVNVSNNLVVDTNTLYVSAADNKVGVGTTSPSGTLGVSTSADANAVRVQSTFPGGIGISVDASGGGAGTTAVWGSATASGAVSNFGGLFTAAGNSGRAVSGDATAVSGAANYGGYFQAQGTGGAYGVFATATGASGTNYGVYSNVTSPSSWGGYFAGGKGVFTPQLCLGTEANCRTDWPSSGIGGSGTANYLAKFTAGTTVGNSVIYDNGTNIGIGTTTPAYKLDVNGDIKTGTDVRANRVAAGMAPIGGYGIVAQGTSTGVHGESSGGYGVEGIGKSAGGYFYDSDGTAWAYVGYGSFGVYGWSPTGFALYGTGSTGVFGQGSSMGGNFSNSGDSSYAYLAYAGYGGYFSSIYTPGNATIAGNATVQGKNVCLQDGTNCPASGGTINGSGTANYLAKFTAGTTIGNSAIYDNGTNVGIGTTSPVSKLNLVGTGASPSIPGASSTGVLRIGITTIEGIDIGKMNTSPFSGWIQAGYNATADPLVLQPSGGNVGIGTTNPGSYKIYINGNGYLGASAWTYSSDRRLKENISYLGAGMEIIKSLKPAGFDYINGDKNQVGFIAQDVQKILPNIVTEGSDGMLGIKTESIIPYLVKAVQEQQGQIDQMRMIICQDHPEEDFCKTK